MAQSASERRAAQRRTAKIVRANRAISDRRQQTRFVDLNIRQAVFAARTDYGNRVMHGQEPMPAAGTLEAKNLASLASFSAHGQGDPRFEAAFSRYWYHFKDAQTPIDENDYMFPGEDDFEDSDGEE